MLAIAILDKMVGLEIFLNRSESHQNLLKKALHHVNGILS